MTARVLIGVVTRDKASKTRRVEVRGDKPHPKYGKVVTQTTICHVHDEHNVSAKGDIVEVQECRPRSRLKRWNLVKVVRKNRELDISAIRECRRNIPSDSPSIVESKYKKNDKKLDERPLDEQITSQITQFFSLSNNLPNVPRELRDLWERYLPVILCDEQLSQTLQFLLLKRPNPEKSQKFRDRLQSLTKESLGKPASGIFNPCAPCEKWPKNSDQIEGWFPAGSIFLNNWNVFRLRFNDNAFGRECYDFVLRIEVRVKTDSLDVQPESTFLSLPPRSGEYRDFIVRPDKRGKACFNIALYYANEPVTKFDVEFFPTTKT